MQDVRKKYVAVFDRVVETVRKNHEDFDDYSNRMTYANEDGFVLLTKSAWREKQKWPPPGLWIENLRPELLFDTDGPVPYAGIWVPAKKTGVDSRKARKAIVGAALHCLSEDEQARCLKQPEDEDYLLCYDLPEERDRLLQMLLEGDAQSFVDCMVGHLDLLARFTPVVDKLLGVAPGG
ncbi:MAG TPA: hypothetical protein PLE19_19430 [Planctomycetota bacterium]|nr:hypothetical protein [Planctomycetota bacterium]HRR81219.1 hypothetical protein [Planctomycetota bacterium]HRT93550.1 hypothetical protein [Planctomycetota bacterium]